MSASGRVSSGGEDDDDGDAGGRRRRRVVAVIPSRYGSTRFPGKSLHQIRGKSLVRRTYESTMRCPSLSAVIVATDDRRIFDHVVAFGGRAVMTSPDCLNGTERLAEVVEKEAALLAGVDTIVNVQGDEPCIAVDTVEAVVRALHTADARTPMSTAVTLIESAEDAASTSVVKAVLDVQNYCLYFSRAPIPGSKGGAFSRVGAPTYRHLGIYAYRKEFLATYVALPSTPLQLKEDLEQLKVLEHGYRVRAAVVSERGIGVDTPADVPVIEALIDAEESGRA